MHLICKKKEQIAYLKEDSSTSSSSFLDKFEGDKELSQLSNAFTELEITVEIVELEVKLPKLRMVLSDSGT